MTITYKQPSPECTICRRQFNWEEPIVGKMPENIWFCLECAKKYPDDKKYEGEEFWEVIEYHPGAFSEIKIK